MLNTDLEFSFLRLCFDKPSLWVLEFTPTDRQVDWVRLQVEKYRRKYNKYPEFNVFLDYLRGRCESQQYEFVVEKLNHPLEAEYVEDKVIRFLERTRLEKAMFDAEVLIRAGKVDEAKLILLKGTELIAPKCIDYDEYVEEEELIHRIPTGLGTIDDTLEGGLPRHNLALLVGPKASGKSLTMVNLGANARMLGYNILHISFEDSIRQIRKRYSKKFGTYKDDWGKLMINEFPSGGATVADCEALTSLYRPDVVIVDYLNEMGSGKDRANRSEELGDSARGLRGMSTRHNCTVITAQQAGRSAKFSEENVSAEDAFWSYEPSQVADVVITLNQTRDEKRDNHIRLVLDRNRNGEDGLEYKYNIDYSMMRMKEVGL